MERYTRFEDTTIQGEGVAAEARRNTMNTPKICLSKDARREIWNRLETPLRMFGIVAILAVVGVVISLMLGADGSRYTAAMVPLIAGGFIYIAGADLIPELHKEHEFRASMAQIAVVLVGVGLMFLLLLLE